MAQNVICATAIRSEIKNDQPWAAITIQIGAFDGMLPPFEVWVRDLGNDDLNLRAAQERLQRLFRSIGEAIDLDGLGLRKN